MSGGRRLASLGDLVFHIRDHWTGRKEFLSIDRGRRRETISAGDFVDSVHCLAVALERAGLEPGERLAIFSENSPEWHTVEFACQLVGGVTVPIYPSLPAEQVAFIVKNSGCRWLFFRHAAQRKVIESVAQGLSAPIRLVAMEDDHAGLVQAQSLTPLLGIGAEHQAAAPIEQFRGRRSADDLASIVYTAGTTGEPKGVMLTHRNLISAFHSCGRVFAVGPEDQALLFLPLASAVERTLANLLLYSGASIHYAQRIEHLPRLLNDLRPTVLSSLPEVFERARARIQEKVTASGGLRRRLFDRAVTVGRRIRADRERGVVNPLRRIEGLFLRRRAHREIAARFGDRLRLALSSGGPLSRETAEFFVILGQPIRSLYGLAEAPVVAAGEAGRENRPGAARALPGCKVRIGSDGEVETRGAVVMQGYWQDPAATAAAVDSDGWLRTGDLGELHGDGGLTVRGRRADLVRTSDGEAAAPGPIESRLAAGEAIDQAIVVGHGFPHLAALIVPNFGLLASRLGLSDPQAIAEDPRARRAIQERVNEVNRLVSPEERIRRWAAVDQPFSLEAGELGPMLALRRRTVLAKHEDLIRSLYVERQAED